MAWLEIGVKRSVGTPNGQVGASIAQVCLLLVLQLILGIGIGVVLGAIMHTGAESVLSWTTAFADVVTLIVCLRVGQRWWRLSCEETLPISRFRITLLIPLSVTIFGIQAVNSFLVTQLIRFGIVPAFFDTLYDTAVWDSFDIVLSLVVIAPIVEEITIRGLVLGALLRRYSASTAVAFSAFAFACLHFSPYQFLGPLTIGLLFGWLRVRCRSLWPGLIGHVMFNAIVILPGLFPVGSLLVQRSK